MLTLEKRYKSQVGNISSHLKPKKKNKKKGKSKKPKARKRKKISTADVNKI